MPRVSVVIPAYNAAALLGGTLESTLNSIYQDMEIVVVNDGSQDETAGVASSFGHRVRVITQKNAGMSASRNRGIEESDSEFIALLDSDDIWHPEKIKWQLVALESHPDHAYCFTEFKSWHGESPLEFLATQRNGMMEPKLCGWIYHKLLLTNWALPSSTTSFPGHPFASSERHKLTLEAEPIAEIGVLILLFSSPDLLGEEQIGQEVHGGINHVVGTAVAVNAGVDVISNHAHSLILTAKKFSFLELSRLWQSLGREFCRYDLWPPPLVGRRLHW